MQNDKKPRLKGDQVKFIRTMLNESQAVFAERLDVSQPVITRLEKKKNEEIPGPDSILIRQIAEANGIEIPDVPIDRSKKTEATVSE